jgi:hypothetical protein
MIYLMASGAEGSSEKLAACGSELVCVSVKLRSTGGEASGGQEALEIIPIVVARDRLGGLLQPGAVPSGGGRLGVRCRNVMVTNAPTHEPSAAKPT